MPAAPRRNTTSRRAPYESPKETREAIARIHDHFHAARPVLAAPKKPAPSRIDSIEQSALKSAIIALDEARETLDHAHSIVRLSTAGVKKALRHISKSSNK